MKILLVCDFRSPTAKNWANQFRTEGNVVHILSTYPVDPVKDDTFIVESLPVAFAQFAPRTSSTSPGAPKKRSFSPKGKYVRNLVMSARDLVAPIELRRHVKEGRQRVLSINPDLVHALRIPYEGMFASLITPSDIPLLISIWGLDLELQALRNPLVASLTRSTLERTDGLLADCQRDVRISTDWGYDQSKPTLVVPGAGGVNQIVFHPGDPEPGLREKWNIPADAQVILNPRGFRGHVRTFELLEAFKLVLESKPNTILVAPGFKGIAPVETRLIELGIHNQVRLGPVVSQPQLADLFRLADICASPSTHDGTPNSLLEAMASGCFPVVGNIESIREWITDGENGLLCDPMDPESIASSLLTALMDDELRASGKKLNSETIQKRASREAVKSASRRFYAQFASVLDSE